jgi:hypothetical protein
MACLDDNADDQQDHGGVMPPLFARGPRSKSGDGSHHVVNRVGEHLVTDLKLLRDIVRAECTRARDMVHLMQEGLSCLPGRQVVPHGK